jgi:hypothetical protein
MIYQISKVEIAVDQLDWAIRLFIDHKAYVPAITLAGVAEEILGNALNGDSMHAMLKRHFSEEMNISEKDVSDKLLNNAKNHLKHLCGLSAEDQINIDLEGEAIQYITRATKNLALYDRSASSETPRFDSWLKEHKPHLLPKASSD